MPLLVFGLSHHSAPVDVRERFAFAAPEIPGVMAKLREQGLAQEVVILSTCNRVELYVAVESPGPDHFQLLEQSVWQDRQFHEPLSQGLYTFTEPQSLEHLFRVACGLDSMLLGETEILGQLKSAYDLACQHRCTGSRLNKAFQRAFQAAKQVRTETQIQRGSVSVASAAVELAERIFSSLRECCVMVIGAGDTSEKTARALLSRGAKHLMVTNRTQANAEALASALGGETVPFDSWDSHFDRLDIVISSTASPHYVLDRPRLEPLMKRRHHRELLLIDIAVPRDIDPDVNKLENVFLYNIDDLKAVADDYMKMRRLELDHCESIIQQRIKKLLESFAAASRCSSSPLRLNPQE